MRIAVMGSGGVGGYFGARLAHGGADVTFIARGAHLAAMWEHGLSIESKLGNLHLPNVAATNDPQTIGPVDLILFCVKLWDTETAARSLLPLIRPDTAVLSLQNGVQKDDVLRAAFGGERVMGGVCYVASNVARPGVIMQTGTLQRMIFGEYDGRRSPRAEALLAASKRGGIDAELSTDIRRAIWEKYAFLVGLSGATTAMRATIGPIRSNSQSRAFFFDLVQEAAAVGRAEGVTLAADYVEQQMKSVDQLPAEMASSMYHDLNAGRPLELRWLSGGVVELGRKAGVPTPANRAVRDILSLYADGGSHRRP